ARNIGDALEGEIVGRLHQDAGIGQGVADLRAFVEARPPDHAIGQAERDETLLELARLEAGAHEHGDLAQRLAGALQRFDLLADPARLLLAVPQPAELDALARLRRRPQRLAEAAAVVRDQ